MDSFQSHFKLAGCVESNVGVFLFGHPKDECRFCQEDRLVVFVVGDVRLPVFHEVFQINFIATHPTGFVDAAGFKPTFGAVFVF